MVQSLETLDGSHPQKLKAQAGEAVGLTFDKQIFVERGHIISNKGGLPESITDGVILEKLNFQCLYKNIKKLILNKKKLHNIQKNSLKNFYLTNEYISKQIDDYRESFFNIMSQKNAKLKILHVTNFNQRHNGRLFYNSGRRVNNGFIRLNHSVLELSDRDVVSYSRSITDLKGSK